MPKPRTGTATAQFAGKARIIADDETSATAIELPFDPEAVFGKVRAPVVVTLRGYSYRTTIASMQRCVFVPLRREHREGASVKAGDSVNVTIVLDDQPRMVQPPKDLATTLKDAGVWVLWDKLSYTHQREHVGAIEKAKKPETRARRIAGCVERMKKRRKS